MKNLFDSVEHVDEMTSEEPQTNDELYGTAGELEVAADTDGLHFGTLAEQKAYDRVDIEESFDEPENPPELTDINQFDLSRALSSWIPNSEEWLNAPMVYFTPIKDNAKHPNRIQDQLPEDFDEIFTVGKGNNRVGIVMVTDDTKQPASQNIADFIGTPDALESLGRGLLNVIKEYDASRVKTDPFTVYAEMMDGWTYNPAWLNNQHGSTYEQEREGNIAPISDYLQMLPDTEKGREFRGNVLRKVPDIMEFTRSYGETLGFVENICRLSTKDMGLAENIVNNSLNIMIEQGYKKLDEFIVKYLE